jgi:NAD(P) transhydrogenase subunit alpha
MYVNVAVLKETEPLEKRVALVPGITAQLVKLGAKLHMQTDAGVAASFPDAAYKDVQFVEKRADLLAGADVVLCIQPPALDVIDAMQEGAILICFVYVEHEHPLVKRMVEKKITCFAMEKIPRISRAQSMDALSSQSALSGYYSVMLGQTHLGRVLPKVTTAGGAIGPAHVLVMGLGVAGLEAVATAHRLGAMVEGYDIRPQTEEQVLSLGGTFVQTGVDAQGTGGYARELTPEEKTKVAAALTKHIAEADLIVTTAAIPGKPSPKLISKAQVQGMKPGSVIVDLSAEGGGNCDDSIPGETVVVNGVIIAAPLNVPSLLAQDASQLLARNAFNLLKLMLKENIIAIDWTDEVIAKTAITHDGTIAKEPAKVVHTLPAPAPPKAA